ncbi:unnamed protein product [Bursaphelenchus okinawaensis]|uniref:G-protein coupled receptors family 1 profile domain-containing protein n=1 Tax=Bursaphelenchus okinawaensis TaxID=465554 RepID=A0A811KLI6_9BILA|nr:unnamed protein product [Bursaphelenchus okinawaensis]CAG9105983.1 unnamed protein product [Bursaphelenchus okinawaensis]
MPIHNLSFFDSPSFNFSDTDLDINSAVNAAQLHRCKEEAFRMYIAILVVTTALIGLLLSLYVFFISLVNIRGDYRLFVANLAFVDSVCALLYAFMGYVNLSAHFRFPVSIMTYSAFAFYGSFGIMICALVPVSISRIVAASKPKTYDRLFSGYRAFIVCAVMDLLPVILLVVICTAHHDIARRLFFAYASLTVIAHGVTFVSNFLVFWLVANHIKVVECLHDRTRLLETRQVAVATLAQAVVPLICQVPAFLALSSALLLIEPITHQNVIVITQLWLSASPLLDSLITLFVIKQYRIQTLACGSFFLQLDRCLGQPKTVSNSLEQNQISSYFMGIPKTLKSTSNV